MSKKVSWPHFGLIYLLFPSWVRWEYWYLTFLWLELMGGFTWFYRKSFCHTLCCSLQIELIQIFLSCYQDPNHGSDLWKVFNGSLFFCPLNKFQTSFIFICSSGIETHDLLQYLYTNLILSPRQWVPWSINPIFPSYLQVCLYSALAMLVDIHVNQRLDVLCKSKSIPQM